MNETTPLDQETLLLAVRELSGRVPEFGRIVQTYGPPPMWEREHGFGTMVHIILEQQVSLASAQAAFDKLSTAVNPLTPPAFLAVSDEDLRSFGFSRQKTRYCRLLAIAVEDGSLDIAALAAAPTADVMKTLTGLKGIGPWTAGVYLLMVLRRPNIWPTGDRALAVAAKEVFALEEVPSYPALDKMAEAWQPWRAVAARLLWHNYLSIRKK